MAFIARLYDVEREAKSLAVGTRQILRHERAVPVLAEFHTWLTALAAQVLPKSPVGQAIHYVLPRWDSLIRYCEDGTLAIDNNQPNAPCDPARLGAKIGYSWATIGAVARRPFCSASPPAAKQTKWNRGLTCAR